MLVSIKAIENVQSEIDKTDASRFCSKGKIDFVRGFGCGRGLLVGGNESLFAKGVGRFRWN